MFGILRVDIGAQEPTYDLLYPNPNASGGTWVNLTARLGDTFTPALIRDKGSFVYEWALKTPDGKLDVDAAKSRVKRYFRLSGTEQLELSDDGKKLLSADLLDADLAKTITLLGVSSLEGVTGFNADLYTLGQVISSYAEAFLRTSFDNLLFRDWLAEPQNATIASLTFDKVGAMTWASDGLYAVYGGNWWGGVATDTGISLLKLVRPDGTPDLKLIPLDHKKPSSLKIVGDWLYYRYDVLDAHEQTTGFHELARRPVAGSGSTEELTGDQSLPAMEILTYDVSSNNDVLYFMGFDPATNTVVGGKVNMTDKSWSRLDTALRLTQIRVIE
jgi:hypothetical protein